LKKASGSLKPFFNENENTIIAKNTLKINHMLKNKLLNLLFLLAGIFLFAACEYATITPDGPPPPPPPGDTTSFSLEIQPIFDSKCLLCHSGATAPDLRAGKSYQSLFDNNMVVAGNPEQSILYTCLLSPSGSMKDYSNATNNALIYNWIKEGAKNN
jgi:hypothetical protein